MFSVDKNATFFNFLLHLLNLKKQKCMFRVFFNIIKISGQNKKIHFHYYFTWKELDYTSKGYFNIRHSRAKASIHTFPIPASSCWSLSQLSRGDGRVALWTSRQFIAMSKNQNIQSFIATPMKDGHWREVKDTVRNI